MKAPSIPLGSSDFYDLVDMRLAVQYDINRDGYRLRYETIIGDQQYHVDFPAHMFSTADVVIDPLTKFEELSALAREEFQKINTD